MASLLSLLDQQALEAAKEPYEVKVAFSVIILIAGLVGNLVAIFVILILKEFKKSVTHWYVLQLAIADSVFLLTLPFKISEDIEGSWIFPEWMCKAKEALLFINYYASILFLMIMSIDRYIAVCHSFSNVTQKLRTESAAVIIAIIAWAIAILMSIPVMLFSAKIGSHPYCTCSYVFPAPAPNETANCMKEGYKPNTGEFRDCLTIQKLTIGTPLNGEAHCRFVNADDFEDLFANYTGFVAYDNIPVVERVVPVNITTDVTADLTPDIPGSPFAFHSSRTYKFAPRSAADKLGVPSDCHYWSRPMGWSVFLIFNFVGMFLLPFFVMVLCYGLIVHKLSITRVHSSSIPNANARGGSVGNGKLSRRKSSTRSDKDRRRVTIMCASLVICFVICWLPFHATHLAKFAGIIVAPQYQDVCKILPIVSSLLAYLNSALNPYLYSFLGTNFRRRWKLLKESRGVQQFISAAAGRRNDNTAKSRDLLASRKTNDPLFYRASGIMQSSPATTKQVFVIKKTNDSNSSGTPPTPSANLYAAEQTLRQQPSDRYASTKTLPLAEKEAQGATTQAQC
ncbi:unnamed protein product [Clavelina lepadiformis]|uniref:G-protein coupled receptors family 1 profile domain-containing protein n=1 Tax=Clavelina lepadiformis TaxID=159417 RepID=A0ABP0GKS9_CLALP